MYIVQWSKNMKMIGEGEQCSAWLLDHSKGEGAVAGSAPSHAELEAENLVLFDSQLQDMSAALHQT